MQVFDEIAKKFRSSRSCRLVVVDHIPGQIVFGYVGRDTLVQEIGVFYEGRLSRCTASVPLMRKHLIFSNRQGIYMSKVGVPQEMILREVHTKGRGRFPYHFEKKYEACESFGIFDGKQELVDANRTHCLSEYLKYTFGLEFETSQGYVPEDICFRDGLIPLRDGSISGIEYSTVVLEGNKGISLMEQQLESLRRYTDFDKECSLHIHIGGFPLEKDKLFNLYRLCKCLEADLSQIVPKFTFHTSQYKANHKDYCNPLASYRNFEQMYEHLVGRKFFNDFTQPHPNDVRREAKWRIPTR